ncbi:NAD(P)-binding protein [Candidatus Accumulibacter sp. ACC007]|uniref:NAD(P)/FAD-dependent oxidoreductase n=1 Tax=Candidatus Accumulibacter sp. ACC007 TaxID=2823333 RepID=UPI0025B9FBB3|nr:NAD(P)-binding protein [Candidatus Accumulibacter sp. ACC007]
MLLDENDPRMTENATSRRIAATNKEFAPIEIVGAGPAGLAAAITLARGGRKVVLHEAQREVGHRFQGDLQGLENWSGKRDVLDVLRAAGITTDFAMTPCTHGIGFDAWDRRYPLRSSAPILYLVERGPGRGSLDRALLDQALSLGVELRFGSRKDQLHGTGILATGPRTASAIAVGYHFETSLANGFWVILDDALAPGGYAYLLVMGGRGTVKSCMFKGFAEQRTYVQRTVDRFRGLLGFAMQDARFHGGAGNFFVPTTARRGRHLVAGEQAGFQDAFAGFGMRYAILSGVMAARSMLEHTDYDASWQREMKGPIDTGALNRAIYDRLGNHGYRWLLRAQARISDTTTFLRWLYGPSHLRRLLRPWAQRRLLDAG